MEVKKTEISMSTNGREVYVPVQLACDICGSETQTPTARNKMFSDGIIRCHWCAKRAEEYGFMEEDPLLEDDWEETAVEVFLEYAEVWERLALL